MTVCSLFPTNGGGGGSASGGDMLYVYDCVCLWEVRRWEEDKIYLYLCYLCVSLHFNFVFRTVSQTTVVIKS